MKFLCDQITVRFQNIYRYKIMFDLGCYCIRTENWAECIVRLEGKQSFRNLIVYYGVIWEITPSSLNMLLLHSPIEIMKASIELLNYEEPGKKALLLRT